jgi:hypothetical protein
MADEKIECPKCGRKVEPRLWHVRKALAYPVVQHLCSFCGAVMYETGGGTRWGCVIALLAAIIIPIALIVLPALIASLSILLRRHPGP